MESAPDSGEGTEKIQYDNNQENLTVDFMEKIKSLKLKEQKAIWAVAWITLLLAALCIFQIIRPNKVYYREGATEFVEGTAQNRAVYDQIALPFGIYEVELDYQSDTDLKSICTVEDGTVFHGGLLTNGEHLYTGLDKTSFQIWLFERTEALQVCVSYGGEGGLRTGNLVIRETNLLWTSFLIVILFFYVIVTAGYIYMLYDRKYPVAKEKKNVFFGLAMVVLIASLPYLMGATISGADLTYHLQRIEGVKDGLLSGQFPVRLEPEWIQGHGYDNAVFYCNALFLVPALLRMAGFTVTAVYNIYCISLNIATAWIAYYCFYKIFKNRYIGLLCSALYTLSIFRIYKLVITSAVGEGSAVTFLPLIAYGFYRIFTENPKEKAYKTAWIPIAFGYAGLIQTHVLTCEITALVTVLFLIVFCKRLFCKEVFMELFKGAGAAVLMSLWFLVPFLDYYITQDVHIKHVAGRTIQDRGLYPAQLAFHYWKFGENAMGVDMGMWHSHAVGAGLVLVTGFVVFLILWFSGYLREKHPLVRLGKCAAVFGGLMMLMSLHVFPWDKIQSINGLTASLVSSLQFPNRFLGWGSTFLVVVYGCCMWFFLQKKKQLYYYAGAACVLIGVFTSSLFLINDVCCKEDQFTLYNEESMGFGYISGAEYLIEGTQEELLLYKDPVVSSGVNLSEYSKEYLHVKMDCKNSSGEERYIELPILYFRGYQAFVDGSKEKLPVVDGDNHVVRVLLPPGFSGRVTVKFVSPLHWRFSEAVTYLFLTGLLIMAVGKWRRRFAK